MATADARLTQARDAFERRSWNECVAAFADLDLESLSPEDLERVATAGYLTADDTLSADAYARAYQGFLDHDLPLRAARCAFWLGLTSILVGEHARGGGWMGRAGHLVEEHGRECPERGFLMMAGAYRALVEGDHQRANDMTDPILDLAARFDEPDLAALGGLVRGQSLIDLGQTAAGVAVLDEVMVSITAGEVQPVAAGIVYCAVIEACSQIFDIRRAQEWTSALNEWCERQPGLVPYRGQCLVYRSELMEMHGAWSDALDEATRAHEILEGAPAVGMAFYRIAELHRLQGSFERALDAYRRANDAGRSPQPGLALLRLAQGQIDRATGAMARELDEIQDDTGRAALLPAAVEIALSAGDPTAAHAHTEELTAIAERIGAPLLHAHAGHARGAVALAQGRPREGLEHLREAAARWRELDAPYEVARVRARIGVAARELGDEETAGLELDAARRDFTERGARPDLRWLQSLSSQDRQDTSGLTRREREVLTLIATGKTNRAVAEELVISEKTVARHVSNIFTKLGVSSRSAATAFAYENDLV